MSKCAFIGCEKQSEKRGWCGTHYQRWRVHGDVNIVKKAANGNGYIQNGYFGKQINGVRKFDHVRIAEKVLGRELPIGCVVHHANGNKLDNSNENLVICPSRAYHNLIHARLDEQLFKK